MTKRVRPVSRRHAALSLRGYNYVGWLALRHWCTPGRVALPRATEDVCRRGPRPLPSKEDRTVRTIRSPVQHAIESTTTPRRPLALSLSLGHLSRIPAQIPARFFHFFLSSPFLLPPPPPSPPFLHRYSSFMYLSDRSAQRSAQRSRLRRAGFSADVELKLPFLAHLPPSATRVQIRIYSPSRRSILSADITSRARGVGVA